MWIFAAVFLLLQFFNRREKHFFFHLGLEKGERFLFCNALLMCITWPGLIIEMMRLAVIGRFIFCKRSQHDELPDGAKWTDYLPPESGKYWMLDEIFEKHKMPQTIHWKPGMEQ